MTNLIRFLIPSLGDLVAALVIVGTLYVIAREARRQDDEHYEDLRRRASAPRHDAADGHFRIR